MTIDPAALVAPPTLRIALVEDDDGDALLVQAELDLAGSPHTLLRARTMAEARGLMEAEQPDCVLLDLGLPDSLGLDGLRELRSSTAAAVVVLTGHADEHQGIAALSHGAQDYLVKGTVDGRLLLRAVRYAVERRTAERAAAALREAELAALENARLERGLLPAPIVNDPRVQVTTAYKPGRSSGVLGGDFFDVVETDDGVLHVLIGDVCGHSVDEAALGASLRIAWRTLVLSGSPADHRLEVLDRLLEHERHDDDIFATAFIMAIAPDRAGARVWQAGHPAPLLLTRGARAAPVPFEPALALGTGLGRTWNAGEVRLPAPWSLLLFTDGLYEGLDDSDDRRLGQEGLRTIVTDLHASSTSVWLQSLIELVEKRNGGPLKDDVAALLLTVGA